MCNRTTTLLDTVTTTNERTNNFSKIANNLEDSSLDFETTSKDLVATVCR